ncbi:MAG: hypothetical protein IPH07_30755 [Deltaproteobacteria bacterium]|nr:hypothetical protein [Deltaproteobacteria bacterium]MBK8715297.1 hypothetical protein [Deltaproteobacteria bacterium]MBP7285000.1 hypothetical protein [Nannocystaceae bacterium]
MTAPASTGRRWPRRLALVALWLLWVAIGRGFVSSNDGSHVALARALALRHETSIDPDVALTLWVDRAERDGHHYSDRPPGTAFAALPAVWLGAQLDPVLRDRALAHGQMVVRPAGDAFAETYVARARRHGRAPALVQYQGTALLVVMHAAAMGLLGLLALERWLVDRGMSKGARAFAMITVALATSWGPYSTTLFSHVTSGTLWCIALLAAARGRAGSDRWAVIAGLAGAWAVASDYVLVVPIGLQLALAMPPRRWGLLLLGAAAPAIATAAYHHAAFGAWWSIGYDHHAAFAFARERGSTFAGNPVTGAWTLLGLGEGAGVLAIAPVMALGVAALPSLREPRLLLPLLPWLLLLCLHRTPSGGATLDHRYLVPAVPIVGLGLAVAWQRWIAEPQAHLQHPWRARAVLWLCLLVAVASCVLVWSHFVSWRG